MVSQLTYDRCRTSHIYVAFPGRVVDSQYYFLCCSPFKGIDQKLIGGVTLNHLCWASLGGGK